MSNGQEKDLPRHTSTTPTGPGSKPEGDQVVRVLIVDGDKRVGQQVSKCAFDSRTQVTQVGSISEAFKCLNKEPIDLALIEADLPDGSGLALAKRLKTGYATTYAIVMTDHPSLEGTIEAMRLGVVDLICKPLNLEDVKQRVQQAVIRLRSEQKSHNRIKRLKRICRKLNRARDEIASQVDILCNDLVIAYQELAQQVQVLAQTSEFSGLIRQELDLEALLRRTLEYLLQKTGPTNAAIFLPASTDPEEFSLGGYVNYECTSESAEILLQHLADVLAPKMVHNHWPVHITDNGALTQWLGEDVNYLADSHLLAYPCRHEDETLAVIVLFRHGSQPFTNSLIQGCTSIAPLLAETLARVVSIHHRLMPDGEDEFTSDEFSS